MKMIKVKKWRNDKISFRVWIFKD